MYFRIRERKYYFFYISQRTSRIENKDIFVDLRRNNNGTYLKLSERTGKMRKTVLIPASGIKKLQGVLEDVLKVVNNKR